MFKNILAPIDGSDCSLQALDLSASFARDQQAKLTICTVVDPAKAAAMAFGEAQMTAACLDALEEEARALVGDAGNQVRATCAAQSVVLDGPTVDSILDYAVQHGCDLIVVGSHGRTGLPRVLLGSVAEGVVRRASMPVLVVRRRAAPVKEHSPAAAVAQQATATA